MEASTEDAVSSLPPWRLHLNVLAGNSAGAITIGTTFSCFGAHYTTISNSLKSTDATHPENNLYELGR